MDMNTYNTGSMKNCAQEIETQIKKFKEAKEAIDNLVSNLRNNWKDDTNTMYSNKYNNEAKVSAENVQGLMKQFEDLLISTANAYDKIHTQAQNNMQ